MAIRAPDGANKTILTKHTYFFETLNMPLATPDAADLQIIILTQIMLISKYTLLLIKGSTSISARL